MPTRTEPVELLSLKNSQNNTHSLNMCGEYYATLGHKLAEAILQNSTQSEKSLAANLYFSKTPRDSFYMQPTDEIEINDLITQLDSKKAPGIDNINNELVKQIKTEIIKPLTYIFNLSMSTGIFPEVWKTALICPIHKTGARDTPENYRPIALLGVFPKLLEKVMNKRLVNYLESRNLISEHQYGFRKNKSAEDATLLLTTSIANLLDKNKHCIGVFLDLARAFDTVSLQILLKKLEQTGIRGIPLQWFTSYLTNRKQCLKINNFSSQLQTTNFGVPQGSILGPTLFILYINDIHEILLDNANIICYADDTALIFHGSTWEETYHYTQEGITKINNWLQNNLLTLNSSKTKYICFHKTAPSAPNATPGIKIHGCKNKNQYCICEEIERVNVIKYLGIHIDHNLSFKHHTHSLSTRIRKVIGIMKKLRDITNLKTLKLVYTALCQSLLTYCISSWGGAAKTFLIELERAQRSVLKVMLKKPYRYRTATLYKEAKVLNVRQLFILKMTLMKHSEMLNAPDRNELARKRVYKAIMPRTNTAFARRFSPYLDTYIYNRVLKFIDLKELTMKNAKEKLISWLNTLSYEDTEILLKSFI